MTLQHVFALWTCMLAMTLPGNSHHKLGFYNRFHGISSRCRYYDVGHVPCNQNLALPHSACKPCSDQGILCITWMSEGQDHTGWLASLSVPTAFLLMPLQVCRPPGRNHQLCSQVRWPMSIASPHQTRTLGNPSEVPALSTVGVSVTRTRKYAHRSVCANSGADSPVGMPIESTCQEHLMQHVCDRAC